MPSVYPRELKALARAIGRSQAIIEFDSDGTVVRANQNFLDLTGYRADDVTVRHSPHVLGPVYAASDEYILVVTAGLTQRFHRR